MRGCIAAAEGVYSKYRLRSLQDEWIVEYPGLIDFAQVLKKLPSVFALLSLATEEVKIFCLNYAIDHESLSDPLSLAAKEVAEGRLPIEMFVCRLAYAFYRTGIVALKVNTFEPFLSWYDDQSIITLSSVSLAAKAKIHPTFFRVFGTELDANSESTPYGADDD
jgi:hypothetical protein